VHGVLQVLTSRSAFDRSPMIFLTGFVLAGHVDLPTRKSEE